MYNTATGKASVIRFVWCRFAGFKISACGAFKITRFAGFKIQNSKFKISACGAFNIQYSRFKIKNKKR